MWDDWTATEQSNAAADAEDRRRWDRAAGPPTIAPQALERPDTPAGHQNRAMLLSSPSSSVLGHP